MWLLCLYLMLPTHDAKMQRSPPGGDYNYLYRCLLNKAFSEAALSFMKRTLPVVQRDMILFLFWTGQTGRHNLRKGLER